MGLVILLGIGLALLWGAMVASTAWMLTHPPRRTYASAVARGRPGDPSELDGGGRAFEEWTVRSRGRELPVWDVPGDAADGPVIVLVHGWADSRIGGLARVPWLVGAASRIIMVDLPGHGEAPGVCRMGTSEVDDVLALLEHLGPDVRPVLYGWSLGGGIALAAAAQNKRVRGVIAESPYRFADTPARNVLQQRGMPWRLTLTPALAILNVLLGGGLSRERFDRAKHAAATGCPVLVVHGECDEVCPARDGREIAAAAGARGRFSEVSDGRHNDLWTVEELAARCGREVQAFLNELNATAGQDAASRALPPAAAREAGDAQ